MRTPGHEKVTADEDDDICGTVIIIVPQMFFYYMGSCFELPI